LGATGRKVPECREPANAYGADRLRLISSVIVQRCKS
jgi:hypothetical protein